MNIVLYHNDMKHQIEACTRFSAGLLKHGGPIRVINLSLRDKVGAGCDLAVFWGHRAKDIISHQKLAGAHYLVMERGYIGDRFVWTSLGFDGLNGRAAFPNIQDGRARWLKHFQQYEQPWQSRYANIALIMGQVEGDASIQGVNFWGWVRDSAAALKNAGYVPMFRPHPAARHTPPIFDLSVMPGDLQEALRNASIVCTFNSNSGVDSVMAGIPASADDPGSMIFGLCGGYPPEYVDRGAWEQKMSYTQWLPEEIENGDAWAALKTVLNG